MIASPTIMATRPASLPTSAGDPGPGPLVAGPRPGGGPDEPRAIERERRHDADAGEEQVERADDQEHVGDRPDSHGRASSVPNAIATSSEPEDEARRAARRSPIAASARGEVAMTSIGAGEPMKWTTSDPVRSPRRGGRPAAWATSWAITVRRNPSEPMSPTIQATAGCDIGLELRQPARHGHGDDRDDEQPREVEADLEAEDPRDRDAVHRAASARRRDAAAR